jgi:hypothetical protein
MIVGIIPLLGLIVVAYNILVFAGSAISGDWSGMEPFLGKAVFTINMMSGATWHLLVSDLLLTIGLVLLFLEMIRSASFGRAEIFNHALSMAVFVISLIEFLILKGFATSTFFLITLMTLIDVLAGFIIGIISARRDIGLAAGIADHA